MPKPPRAPSSKTRRTNATRDAVADRADPRQAALFDQPLPAWTKPCLPQRAVLYAFDLLFLDGEVLWKTTLKEWRDALPA